jgi:hypothetical protein
MWEWVTTAVIDVVPFVEEERGEGVSRTNHINSGSVFQSGSRLTGSPSCVILTEDTGGVPSYTKVLFLLLSPYKIAT